MTDDDIRTLVRNLQTFIAGRFDSFEAHLSSIESGWANWARDAGRRWNTIEERLQSLEARVASLESTA